MRPIWDRRIPTLLGLFLIVVGVIATSYLVQIGAIPFLRAAPPATPQGIRITNVTDTSFTVTYTTAATVIGSITITNAGQNQVVLDDRDQASGKPTFHQVHSITARNLTQKTSYTFSITSGTTTFLNNGQSFAVTTGSAISSPPSEEDPLAGRLTLPDGSNVNEALIYATSQGGQTLSALVKPTGLYIIPLNSMRTSDLTSYLQFPETSTIDMFAATDTLSSKVIILASKRNPVPTITLGNDYDFTVATTPLASSSALPVGFPSFALESNVQASPVIDSPTKGETFTDQQPVLQGTAQPNAEVSITIHSDTPVTTTVTADANGKWQYRPSTPLAPGQHTVTVVTKDQYGILQTLVQTFTIFQSGTQVAEAATPSATLAPTMTPTSTPTPIASTATIAPTATPTVTQLQLSPTPTPKPNSGLLPTGSSSVVTAGIMGVVTAGIGIVLFIITRGISSL